MKYVNHLFVLSTATNQNQEEVVRSMVIFPQGMPNELLGMKFKLTVLVLGQSLQTMVQNLFSVL